MTDERRIHNRDRSFARILIEVEGQVGYISDVSDRGFKGLFLDSLKEAIASTVLVKVSFEELGLAAFELKAILRWAREGDGCCEVGFELLPGEMSREGISEFIKIREYYASANLPST